MDHIFLPFGASVNELDRVEYRGLTSYLGKSFLDYPRSSGHGFLLDKAEDRSATPSDDDSASREGLQLGYFLQEWLFCGFLQEVFGFTSNAVCGIDMYNHHEFIRKAETTVQLEDPTNLAGHSNDLNLIGEDALKRDPKTDVTAEGPDHRNSKYVLCTSPLRSLAQKWTNGMKSNPQKATTEYKHLNRCLKIISRVLSQPALALATESRVAIAVTVDFVVTMIDQAFKSSTVKEDDPLDQSSWFFHGWNATHTEKMKSLGWCPHEAATLHTRFPSLQYLHFCAHMQRPKSEFDHSKCTPAVCSASGATELPLHRHGHPEDVPRCRIFNVEQDLMRHLLDIIKDGDIPLLDITSLDKDLDVQITRRKTGDQYVALSHVWSDGLGNPTNNALPLCQLLMLFSRISQIRKQNNIAGNEKILIWIDSLFCPIEPNWAKVSVLTQMRRIYEEAEYVLVLDSELELIDNRGMGILETAFRVLKSNWMRRLWTLQEAFLARKLWVQFRHEAFDLDQLKTLDVNLLSIETLWFGRVVKTMYSALRRRLMADVDNSIIESTFLNVAIRERAVTLPSDEPLCIAVLLDLDVKSIAEVDQTVPEQGTQDRMKILWSLMENSRPGISMNVLFHNGSKLKHPGYRWAPSSFLKQGQGSNIGAWVAEFSSQPASICPRGLLVRFEGGLISPNKEPMRCLQWQFKLRVPDILKSDVCVLRDNSGQWYVLYRMPDFNTSHGELPERAQDMNIGGPKGGNTKEASHSDHEHGQYGVIIRNNIINKLTSRGPASSDGLLVRVEEITAEKIFVRRVHPILLQIASPSKCVILELAHDIARTIGTSDLVANVRRSESGSMAESSRNESTDETDAANAIEITALISKSTKEALEDNPLALTAMRENDVKNPQSHLEAHVGWILAGCFELDIDIRPVDQGWVVD